MCRSLPLVIPRGVYCERRPTISRMLSAAYDRFAASCVNTTLPCMRTQASSRHAHHGVLDNIRLQRLRGRQSVCLQDRGRIQSPRSDLGVVAEDCQSVVTASCFVFAWRLALHPSCVTCQSSVVASILCVPSYKQCNQ